MSNVKVWLGGEGPSEIGNRDYPDGTRVGAVEALLLKIEPEGWRVAGATVWRRIRKLTVGAALGRDNHGDIHSVAGIVNAAVENECAVVAFVRDVDADRDRAGAIRRGVEFAAQKFPAIGIVGGPAIPALEGWVLALRGVRDTERMSRDRANQLLAERDLAGKHAEDYVGVIEDAKLDALPPGCDALTAWIACARRVLGGAIRGAGPQAAR